MNIKPLIVKSYLESLTEEGELNRIFPILLTSLGFEILTTPKENKGIPEYGKDIVAVGNDIFVEESDESFGKKKRFYFELKGGEDKDITTTTLNKPDGILESLRELKYVNFPTSYSDFEKLPKKILLVHNGITKATARELFSGFVKREFPNGGSEEFQELDIMQLTIYFSDNLFSAYLLTDQNNTKLFNKVLINFNASTHLQVEYIELINNLFSKNEWTGWSSKKREWILLFETLKLISFIIYTESKDYNNFELAKNYLTHLIVKFWHWILKNKLEKDKKVIEYFTQTFDFYFSVLNEYFQRTLPIAIIRNGLSSENSGRYEQVGYTKRTFEYLEYLSFYINVLKFYNSEFKKDSIAPLVEVLNANSVSFRPLIDISSIPIVNILNLFLDVEDKTSAINYWKGIISYLKVGKEKSDKLPDARNNYESVIRLTVTGEKPVYYSDSTSPLLAILIEYTAILELEKDYYELREFIIDNKIDLGVFTPHHGITSTSRAFIQNNEEDLEELLFSNPYFNEGYQHVVSLYKDFNEKLSFEDFKKDVIKRKEEFNYEYRTDEAGFSFLKDLAHIYFKTPFFPDKWRGKI